jgi:hypothetical protein
LTFDHGGLDGHASLAKIRFPAEWFAAVIASEAKQSMFPLHVRMAFDHGGAGLLRLTLATTSRRGRESIRRISYDGWRVNLPETV